MKILVVQDRLRSGGTERQSILLARGFARAGHTTTLLTFRPGGALADSVDESVALRALQPFDTGMDWFAPGLVRVARRTLPDVILCMGRMANCYASSLQQACRRAIVIGTMRTGKNLPYLFRRSLRRVPHVVANSRDARDNLVSQHHIPVDKISVIYNSLVFPASASTQRNEATRAAHGAKPGTVVLLCVAMFRPEKNQRELIEIVSGLPAEIDWQLWLAGDGPTRADCERYAGMKKLTGRVKFMGLQRDPSMIYRAADIAVHASWSESLSNFLIESQAYGLPAVAYAAQGIRESFIPERTGWAIPHGDRAAFRIAIERLLTDSPTEREKRSADARNYARQTFDPDRQIASYLELFERLAPDAADVRESPATPSTR